MYAAVGMPERGHKCRASYKRMSSSAAIGIIVVSAMPTHASLNLLGGSSPNLVSYVSRTQANRTQVVPSASAPYLRSRLTAP